MAKSSVDDASALRQQKQRRPSMAGPPSSASVRRTAFRNVRTKLGMAVVSLVLFAVIVWFVQTTSSAIMRSHDKKRLDVVLRMPSSTALAVLRTLQALLTIISSSALVGSFELLLWVPHGAVGRPGLRARADPVVGHGRHQHSAHPLRAVFAAGRPGLGPSQVSIACSCACLRCCVRAGGGGGRRGEEQIS